MNGSSKLLEDAALQIYNTQLDSTILLNILFKIKAAFKNKVKKINEKLEESKKLKSDLFIAADEAHLINPTIPNIILGYSRTLEDISWYDESTRPSNLYPVTYALQIALHKTDLSSILAGSKVAFYRKELDTSQSAVIFEEFIFNFETCQDPLSFLSKYTNLDVNFLRNYEDKISSLAGRYRDSANLIYYIKLKIDQNKTKTLSDESYVEKHFDEIVNDAYSYAKSYKNGFTENLNVNSSYSLVRELLTRKEIQVPIKSVEFDLFSLLNCSSYEKPMLTLNLDEPISEACLKNWFTNNFMRKYDSLIVSDTVLTSGSCRGTIIEDILLNQLYFIGAVEKSKLIDLHLFNGLLNKEARTFDGNKLGNVFELMNKFIFEINSLQKIKTANEDIDFLFNYQRNVGVLLSPSQLLGPDGVVFLKNQNGEFLLILFRCKFTTKTVSKKIKLDNEKSTDVSKENTVLNDFIKSHQEIKVIRFLFEIDIFDNLSNSFKNVSDQPFFHFDKFSFINLFNYEKTNYFYKLLSDILCGTDVKSV